MVCERGIPLDTEISEECDDLTEVPVCRQGSSVSDMDIDGANSVEASGLAAGSVGDGAGEALGMRCCLETACHGGSITSHVDVSIAGAWRCTDGAMTPMEIC